MRTRAMIGALAASATLIGLYGCGEENATAPETGASLELTKSERDALAAEVRQLPAAASPRWGGPRGSGRPWSSSAAPWHSTRF